MSWLFLALTESLCFIPGSVCFSALIRPGRFDMQVTVPKPDVRGRTEILNWYLKKIKVDPGVTSTFCSPSQMNHYSIKA